MRVNNLESSNLRDLLTHACKNFERILKFIFSKIFVYHEKNKLVST